MADKSRAITTEELWARLFAAKTASGYMAEYSENYELPSFADYISDLCRSRGEKPEQIIRRANVDSSYGHRLFAGGRNPSRDTVIQFAYGFELDVNETQQLLVIARHAGLHPKIKRDSVIAFCIHNKLTLVETQQHLYDNNLPLIGGGRLE